MEIYVTHSTYQKVNNKWILTESKPKTEISEQRYLMLRDEKLKGDRRQFYYSYEFGQRLMYRLSTTCHDLGLKSVREFTFESEEK